MLDKNVIINVTNRDNGTVGYSIPELGVNRTFAVKQTKEITMDQLRKLSYISGGQYILNNCLILDNKDAVKQLIGAVEPQYFYTENQIIELLTNGSLEQLQDCLDFSPDGVIELVKNLAVQLEINDIRKRNAILKKTGFDVSRAIEINHESAQDTEQKQEKTVTRRAAPIETVTETPQRRAAAPKYKL